MIKQLDKKYNNKEVEKSKYDFWKEKEYFKAENNSSKKPYAIIIPPPNITGKLHLGHAWDTTLQDAMIRYKKMCNYDTVYIPGMDHAGIATQAKVEQELKKQNISRYDIGREEFIKKIWEWKDEFANKIYHQWSKLGLSLDYSKEKFTYSPEINETVNYVFTSMYNKKMIYKAKKIINWDPVQKTAISNIEVIFKEIEGSMYYFKYILSDDATKALIIATTRPETMFGDVCVVVNPNDTRYTQFIDKNVINPVNNNIIPIIADLYVDPNFGTGVMKCTPAHDANDYLIGLKYNLNPIICMNEDGTLNEITGEFNKLDRFEARIKIIKKLTLEKTFIKEEKIVKQVGFSERSGAIIEPYLSEQWFVKMDHLAENVLKFQNSPEAINFFPSRFNNTLINWMQNINDWTISRQLWWGHQIPAWYHKKTKEIYVGSTPPKNQDEWTRDEDVLDTWFSSALWGFIALEWNKDSKNSFFDRYFPSNVLITGYDIIFFWVARMIFQSLNFVNKKPFLNVLIHGLVRDEFGKKMSKSLGNGIDPMQIIDKYGADALRHSLLSNSSPGQDIKYSEEKVKASWNFINKIWNAARFVMINISKISSKQEIEILLQSSSEAHNLSEKWILNKLCDVQKKYFEAMEKYEFTIVDKLLYKFIWDDYCSWYLELAKTNIASNNSINSEISKAVLGFVLKEIILMLNPIMPFVTEEIYQYMNLKKSIMLESFDNLNFKYKVNGFEEIVLESIIKIREFRTNQDIKKTQKLMFTLNFKNSFFSSNIKNMIEMINIFTLFLTNSSIGTKEIIGNKTSIRVYDCTLEILNLDFIDFEKQYEKLISEKFHLENEINRGEKLLKNEDFLSKANPEKVEIEKQKQRDYMSKYNLINEEINKFKK